MIRFAHRLAHRIAHRQAVTIAMVVALSALAANASPIVPEQGQYPADTNQDARTLSKKKKDTYVIGEGVTSTQTLSAVWEKRQGMYQAVNGGWLFRPKFLKLAYQDGELTISTSVLALIGWYDNGRFYLRPIDDTTADVYEAGNKTGKVVRFQNMPDGSIKLSYLGYEFRK